MRIVSMKELEEAEIVPYLSAVAATSPRDCCAVEIIAANKGCDATCVGSYGDGWEWHGSEGERPTPESVHYDNDEIDWRRIRLPCGHMCDGSATFNAYRVAVHNRASIASVFDEEAERSRLMAIER